MAMRETNAYAEYFSICSCWLSRVFILILAERKAQPPTVKQRANEQGFNCKMVSDCERLTVGCSDLLDPILRETDQVKSV